MVVKIKPPTGGMSTAIAYNERKVSAQEAEVICCMNMDSEGRNAVQETFSRYEKLNIRSSEVCFHMSVNPGPGEMLTDDRAKELVGEIMDELGYGRQPYVIYRHHDIEREHFHVLSIRINEKGRKITSFQENRRCQKLLESVREKYGFVIGNKDSKRYSEEGINPRLFDYRNGNVSAQMDAVFEECLKYRFRSFREFEQVMLDHNVAVKQTMRRMYLQGVNSDGNKCTGLVSKPDLMSRMLDRMQECMSEDRTKAAHRVAQIGATLLPYAKSERHFGNMMLRKNIHVLFSKDSGGRINDAMYIDHEGRNVFGGNELGHEMSLSMLQDAQKNQWEQSEGHHVHIDVGTFLFSVGGGSKGQEKDPKYRKKRNEPHL